MLGCATNRIKVLCILLSVVNMNDAFAQACCTSSVPMANNQLDFTREEVGLSIAVDYDYNYLNDLVSENVRLDDRLRERISHAVLFSTTYMIDSSWGVNITLPYSIKIESNTSLSSSNERFENKVEGIADLSVFLKYQSRLTRKLFTVVSLGVKMPTGAIDHQNGETNILYAADLQPGTGSWDGLAILEGVYQLNPRWSLTTGAGYTLTSTASRFNDQVTYNFGNTLQVLAGGAYTYQMRAMTLSPSVNLRIRHSEKDISNGTPEPNTGGFWSYLQPAVQLNINNKWYLLVNTQIPIYRQLVGTQLTTTFRVRVGAKYVL